MSLEIWQLSHLYRGRPFYIDGELFEVSRINWETRVVSFYNANDNNDRLKFTVSEVRTRIAKGVIVPKLTANDQKDYSDVPVKAVNLLPERYREVAYSREKVAKRAVEALDDGLLWADVMEMLSGCVVRTIGGNSIPIKKRTLEDYVSAYRQERLWGLVPRYDKSGNRTRRFDDLFVDCALGVIEDEFIKFPNWTITDLCKRIKQEYEHRCDQTGQKYGFRGPRCVAHILNEYFRLEILRGQVKTKRASSILRKAIRQMNDLQILQRVELDCFTLPNFVLNTVKGALAIRPRGCVIIDVATGIPLAIKITLGEQNGELVSDTIVDALGEKGQEYFDKYGIPHEYRFELTGTPVMVVLDHGAENYARQTLSALSQIGVDARWCLPGRPDCKPFVERFIRELKEFLQTFPGGTVSHVKGAYKDNKRTEEAQAEASEFLEALDANIQQWKYMVYCMNPKARLTYRFGETCNPREAMERMSDQLEVNLPPSPEVLRRARFIFEDDTRRLQHYGIEFKNLKFQDCGDGEFAKLWNRLGASKEVWVAYDPMDCREILVIEKIGARPILLKCKEEFATSFKDVKRLQSEMRKSPQKAKADNNYGALIAREKPTDGVDGDVKKSTKAASQAARNDHRLQTFRERSRRAPAIGELCDAGAAVGDIKFKQDAPRRRAAPKAAPREEFMV